MFCCVARNGAHWPTNITADKRPYSVLHDGVDFDAKSADGSLQDDDAVGRDLAGPVAKHVHHVDRARRGTQLESDIRRRESAYVCEDDTLRLSCTAGKHIDVLRANFGRFSITRCNPSGFLDLSVNCAGSNSLPVLTQRFVPLLPYSALFALFAAICAYLPSAQLPVGNHS